MQPDTFTLLLLSEEYSVLDTGRWPLHGGHHTNLSSAFFSIFLSGLFHPYSHNPLFKTFTHSPNFFIQSSSHEALFLYRLLQYFSICPRLYLWCLYLIPLKIYIKENYMLTHPYNYIPFWTKQIKDSCRTCLQAVWLTVVQNNIFSLTFPHN